MQTANANIKRKFKMRLSNANVNANLKWAFEMQTSNANLKRKF